MLGFKCFPVPLELKIRGPPHDRAGLGGVRVLRRRENLWGVRDFGLELRRDLGDEGYILARTPKLHIKGFWNVVYGI